MGDIGKTKKTIILEPLPEEMPEEMPVTTPVTAPDREAVPA
jgi:hypothetical protein